VTVNTVELTIKQDPQTK